MNQVRLSAVLAGQCASANVFEITGRSSPLGATVVPGECQFQRFSHGMLQAWSCCSSTVKTMPRRRASLRSIRQPYLPLWHVFVPRVLPGSSTVIGSGGRYDPANGLTFDSTKVLLDPYGRGVVVPDNYSRDAARREGDNAAMAMKSVVVDPSAYDWEGDRVLRRRPRAPSFTRCT